MNDDVLAKLASLSTKDIEDMPEEEARQLATQIAAEFTGRPLAELLALPEKELEELMNNVSMTMLEQYFKRIMNERAAHNLPVTQAMVTPGENPMNDPRSVTIGTLIQTLQENGVEAATLHAIDEATGRVKHCVVVATGPSAQNLYDVAQSMKKNAEGQNGFAPTQKVAQA